MDITQKLIEMKDEKAIHKVNYGSTSSCTACAKNTYSAAGAGVCSNCPAGQYTAGTGSTGCSGCPSGVVG